MTTDIERQFFGTFGIEPEYQDRCTVEDKYWDNEELANEYGTFDQYMNAKCGNQEDCTTECSCAYQKEIYPQITDRILLELICIANEHENYSATTNMKNIKERTLRILLKTKKYLKDTYSHKGCHNGFVRKVSTLFKEQNNDR